MKVKIELTTGGGVKLKGMGNSITIHDALLRALYDACPSITKGDRIEIMDVKE